MKKNLKNKKKGFTLIELIIVIAIIAIIAAIAIPRFGSVTNDAKLNADIANAKTIANATSALIADGSLPITAAQNNVPINDAEHATGDIIEGYLQSVPTPETAGFTHYVVHITAEGNVSVGMSNGTDVFDLYPEADSL